MNPLITRKKRPTEVNIVPLIDVLMVLIFFFLVTMQFRQERTVEIDSAKMRTVEIDLAKIETAGSMNAPNRMTVSILEDGSLKLSGKPITREALAERFVEIAAQDPQPTVMIEGDRKSPLEAFTGVLDEARKAELKSVEILSKQ